MATLTSTKVSSTRPVKSVHAGAQSISVVYSLTASLSAGDVIQMVKIPSGAVVTDIITTVLMTAANTTAANIGDGDSSARFLASTSMSNNGVVRATLGLPYSYSQDDTIDISFTVVTSATVAAAMSIAMTVTYKMDDPLQGG